MLRQFSYLLLQQDSDRDLADRVLCEILARAPADAEARHNLALPRGKAA